MVHQAAPAVARGTWMQRLIAELAGQHGLELDYLVDGEMWATAAFGSGLAADRAAQLDGVDLALARWIAGLAPVTRQTYQQNLRGLAMALGYEYPRPVRALIDAAIADPDAMDGRLRRFRTSMDWKTGTLRARLSALHRATHALAKAGLVKRPVAYERPRDTDVTVRVGTRADIEKIDAWLRADAGPVAARTRAALHLAWCATLSPRELLELERVNVNVRTRSLVLANGSIYLDRAALRAVRGWLAVRGDAAGPLLLGLDGKSHRVTSKRITSRELQRSFANAARKAGAEITLSGVRNAALLRIAEETGREVAQRSSGNSSRDGVNRLLRSDAVNFGASRTGAASHRQSRGFVGFTR